MEDKRKVDLMDKALEMILNDMDDMEGNRATSHSLEECPDPLSCSQHDSELGDMAPEKDENEPGSPAAVEITVHKMGIPSMEGEKLKEEDEGDHLTSEEAEDLKKLLK